MMEPLSNDPRSQASIPPTGRLAGIDFGTVRIGIAMTDPSRIIASPLETYTRQSQEQDRDYFVQLVESEGVVAFLVGLPVHMSGDESQKSQEAREFAQWFTTGHGTSCRVRRRTPVDQGGAATDD